MKKTVLILMVAILSMGMLFAQGASEAAAKDQYEIIILVKSMGNGFFDACFKGSEEAAAELGNIKTTYMGPTQATAEGQIEIIETLIA